MSHDWQTYLRGILSWVCRLCTNVGVLLLWAACVAGLAFAVSWRLGVLSLPFWLLFAGVVGPASLYLALWQHHVHDKLYGTTADRLRVDLMYGWDVLRSPGAWAEVALDVMLAASAAHAVGRLLAGQASTVGSGWVLYSLVATLALVLIVNRRWDSHRLERLLAPGLRQAVGLAPLLVPAGGYTVLAVALRHQGRAVPTYLVSVSSALLWSVLVEVQSRGRIRRYDFARRAFADAVDVDDAGQSLEPSSERRILATPDRALLTDRARRRQYVLAMIRTGDVRRGLDVVNDYFPRDSQANKRDWYVYETRLRLSLRQPSRALDTIGEFESDFPGGPSKRMTSYKAVALMQQGKFKEAMEILERAIHEAVPPNAYFHMHLSECYYEISERKEDLGRAIEEAVRATRAEPAGCLYVKERLAFYYGMRSECLSSDSHDIPHESDLLKALHLILEAMKTYYRGIRPSREGGVSLRQFESIAGMENAVLLSTYALVLIKLRCLYPAQQALDQCIRVAPSAPTPHYLVSLLAHQRQNAGAEKRALRRAIALMKQNWRGYLMRLAQQRLDELS